VKRRELIILSSAVLLAVGVVALQFGVFGGLNGRQAAPAAESAEPKAKKPPTASRQEVGKFRVKGPYIVIDRYANQLFLRTQDSVLLSAQCSTGSGAELEDTVTGRRWKFDTPPGVFKVSSKLEDPWWRKPDWAFIEEGEKLPSDDRERLDPYMLGEYAIGFGDGFYIHGTLYERLLGVSVTHGCVRLASEDLRKLYARTQIGMYIFVY
jgi:lipoprotein-anchoring transpeptidase ErfK/SrfK